jgi:OPT family oligopeptide transporter
MEEGETESVIKVLYKQALILKSHVFCAMLSAGCTGRERSKEAKLRAVFMGGGVPLAVAAAGYVVLVAVATGTIPALFPALKWYHVLLCYAAGPWLGFCNAYGAGLTNWNTAATYGKLGLFVFSAMVGSSDGGVIAGLAACGITISIVSAAADLMQDLRTGYLTETPPSSMLASQLIGAALGCIIAPLAFWMLWSSFDVGDPEGQYPAPLALLYREMAIIAAEGLSSSLPLHCLQLCYGFFSFALLLDALRDMAPPSVSRFIPVPIALAIPFYIGAYFPFDFFLGSAIVFLWQRHSNASADRYASAVASGLICGDGLWAIPSAALSLFSVNPPICMSFASSS